MQTGLIRRLPHRLRQKTPIMRGHRGSIAEIAGKKLIAPISPHIAEELWSRLGGNGFVSLASWPTYDTAKVVDDVVTMAVQVNGKTRGTIELAVDAAEETAMIAARGVIAVKNALEGKTVVKVIYKPTKILNIIIK